MPTQIGRGSAETNAWIRPVACVPMVLRVIASPRCGMAAIVNDVVCKSIPAYVANVSGIRTR